MTLLSRTLCLIIALALLVPVAAYPALAEDAAATAGQAPASDTALAPSTTVPSSDAGTAAPATTSSTDAASSGTAASSSNSTSSSDSSTSSTTDQKAVNDTSSSSSDSASSTESASTVAATSTAPEASTTVETGTASSIDVAPMESSATAPPLPVATTTLDSTATTSSTSPGTATSTADAPASATTTTITTGDATAGANIVNVAEANFVNSAGAIVLGNYFGTSSGIDLRTATSSFSTGAVCLLFACTGSEGVSVNLDGTSTLANLLTLNATTGGNVIDAPSSMPNAAILTGNALVGLNLVNLANLNIVDSNYLIAALNLFNGLSGDLVFPGLAGFFDALSRAGAPSNVSLGSTAGVDNQIAFDTSTGGNSTDATSSSIATGSTSALGTILNQLNSSLIGGGNVAILLRITGTWNGQIFGAPDGLSVIRGDDGSIYITKAGQGGVGSFDSDLSASTTALITNHATLGAATGGNGIFGADSARILTGDARAAANVLTLANQNIIGRNWLTAVINIFGNWNGNLDFGRPDLWVGETIDAPGQITDGSAVTLHFSIMNRGDAPADGASFTAAIPSELTLDAGESLTTTLGTLQPRASKDITLHATVHAGPGTLVTTSGSATETETDNNLADNTDQASFTTFVSDGGGSNNPFPNQANVPVSQPMPHPAQAPVALVVTRTTAHELGTRTGTVHEELSVENPTDATSSAYDLHDLAKDPSGTVINDQAWSLGTVAPHEVVTVSYDVAFDAAAPAGIYELSTVLASDEAGDREFKDNGSIILTGAAPLLGHPHGKVAGVATSSAPTIMREAAVATSSVALPHAPSDPLLAAALSAHLPWSYAAGFALAFGFFALLSWAIVRLRSRHF